MKCLCESVFASCKSNADEPIYERDGKKNNYCLENIKGDCQDLINFITMSTKYIRLVVIDYAGFSTNPDDIRSFFRNHKQLKEIVVDEGHTVSCFSRYDILRNDSVIEKFRCRKACEKRSVGI
ncbi:hypothetical protein BDF21DRAFT_383424 [Thamnidium elegans]|nr:hypothetical protein BDF21DRAFT_383424 [Thamnidium elegans]